MNNRVALTLIELLLVLAVMATAACLVLPNLFGTQQHLELRAQAARIADDLGRARQLAVDQAMSVCFGFEAGGSSYWLGQVDQSARRELVQLTPGTTLHLLAAQRADRIEIVFHSAGTATPCQFEVRGTHGSMLLGVERLTGCVTAGEMP